MATTRTTRYTPGVYVTELPAFAPSIVGVGTAVPIFIGYTQFARNPSTQKQAYMQAVPLSSLADYYSWFGDTFDAKFKVVPGDKDHYDFQTQKQKADDKGEPIVDDAGNADYETNYYKIVANKSASDNDDSTQTVQFNLAAAIKLFYSNGGGNCYVVSVNDYYGTKATEPTTDASLEPKPVNKDELLDGLKIVAQDTVGPTMTVVPDACLLDPDPKKKKEDPDTYNNYGEVIVVMVNQAAELQDRVAILDLPGSMNPNKWNKAGLAEMRTAFWDQIGKANNPSYGAAYAPTLKTTTWGEADIDYTNLQADQASSDLMKSLLQAQLDQTYPKGTAKNTEVQAKLDRAFPSSLSASEVTSASDIQSLDQYLVNALPLLGQVENILLGKLNVAPPSGLMAGVWSRNDANRGVWNAPANLSLISVISPEVMLTDADQGDYNVPLNGYAINIMRAFSGRGTVVWGARTLMGNSPDFRYIQVRRTLIYIEQSIKTALKPFVFTANTGQTWVTVCSMISDFLTSLWTQGGLMGDKASDAFNVQCGLGSTMTAKDILDGYMIVQVTLQLIRPAEFIELTFTQKMQES